MNILELRDNLAKVNIPEKVVELYEKHAKEFLAANRSQMWNGKNADGSNITPGYTEDPYFKTRKQAEAYKKWKSSPGFMRNSTRDANTPNLFINGYFYNTLVLNASETPTITVSDSFGSKVASSHPAALGVSKENVKDIAERVYLPDFFKYLEDTTGLKFN